MTMKLIDLLRAKSVKKQEDSNILLGGHTAETLNRLKQFNDYLVANQSHLTYGWYADEKKRTSLFKAIVKALVLHDLGKIDYDFQWKVHETDKKDYQESRKVFDEKFEGLIGWGNKTKGVRHEIYSIFWSAMLLKDSDELAGQIRTAILFHHYNEFYVNRQKEFREIIDAYQKKVEAYLDFLTENHQLLSEFLKDLFKNLKTTFKDTFIETAISEMQGFSAEKLIELNKKIKNDDDDINLEFYAPEREDTYKQQLNFLVLLGILRRCDHCASGNIKIEETTEIAPFYASLLETIKKKLTDNGAKKIWQENALPAPIADNRLHAPTGSGKTEFSIFWANQQPRKLIYTLPLRVALNDLYNKRFMEDYSLDKDQISLLHSTAFLEYSNKTDFSVEYKMTSSKQFSSPIILTTPDQVFLSSLKYYGSDKLYALYPLSSIVIDEIQAYNPEMAAIIFQTLENIKILGGRVLIMTATHPPYYDSFLKNYEKIEPHTEVKNYGVKRHKLEFIDGPMLRDGVLDETKPKVKKSSKGKEGESKKFILNSDIIQRIKEFNKQGKNVLIIVNTVKKSIELYKELKDIVSNSYLLHSRIIEREKRKRTAEVKEALSDTKTGKRTEPIILVSTQMVEASVDVDFDVLITEISSIDSQIQRWGRIFRNRGEEQYQGEPNIIVFGEADKATKSIYDKDVVEKTAETLEQHSNKSFDFEDENKLVNEVFNQTVNNQLLKEKYERKISETMRNLKYFSAEKCSEAQRLFRKIAGTSFVFPNLMSLYEDWSGNDKLMKLPELAKELAKLMKEECYKEASWKTIVEEIKKSVPNIAKNDEQIRFALRSLLFDFSINLPLYYTEKRQNYYSEFKGFNVFNLYNEKNEDVITYGIDIKEDIDKYLEEENNMI